MLAAVCAMVLGHTLGNHSLEWTRSHISTFAAHAPYGDLITLGMLLVAAFEITLGLQLTFSSPFKHMLWAHAACQLLAVSASGIVILAAFEESLLYSSPRKHEHMGPLLERQQYFHECGVLLFFTSALLASCVAGTGAFFSTPHRTGKLGGLAMLLCIAMVVVCQVIDNDVLYVGKGLRQRGIFVLMGLAAFILKLLCRPDKRIHPESVNLDFPSLEFRNEENCADDSNVRTGPSILTLSDELACTSCQAGIAREIVRSGPSESYNANEKNTVPFLHSTKPAVIQYQEVSAGGS